MEKSNTNEVKSLSVQYRIDKKRKCMFLLSILR